MIQDLAAKKKWTVMVYMAGDNDLDANGVTDIKEMKEIGSTPDVNIIVQFDRAGARLPTKRYFIKKGTSPESDIVESIGETNTGKPEFLLDFIKWGSVNYPADNYILILWNHGQGWDDTDIFAGERVRGIRLPRSSRLKYAFFKTSVQQAAKISASDNMLARAILVDDDAKDFLDNLEMKKVLLEAKKILGKKLDILGMDACLMSMAEVAYQVHDSVSYVVGSEETEPLDGWPYNTILKDLTANPAITPRDLSKNIVKKYIESYKGTNDEVTQSALDLKASASFAKAVKALVDSLTAGVTDAKTLTILSDTRLRVQEYEVNDNIDLINFCQLLKNSDISENIRKACDGVIEALKGASGLVISSGYIGKSMKQSNGVAIYFPMRILSPLYAGLDFTRKTKWGSFLKAYIKATRSQ